MILHEHLRKIERPNRLPSHVLNIGLTGGMGSGKSTVARLLSESGAAVIDLDAIAHELTESNGAAMSEIERVFGRKVLAEDGALNRAVMRELIFGQPHLKERLETIMHPLIFSQAVVQAHLRAQADVLCVVYDIPLLARSHEWQALLDWIVVVDCAEDIRVQRILKRNPQLNIEQIKKIISTQASFSEMQTIADVVLNNSENDVIHLQLKAQLNILVRYIRHFSSSHTT
ncbi:dephospho-CoA kinase [Hydromonas duriensis]|uniref:Dephospho-CoA kinase n=1 Tax=Hydromonas duriensis TaxID=1527608 RepID=A0A4R6Y457_9BURK|nr:dephospho-CoA kinase [Hydromonas duriensis]TDR28809.1 dephospho-CoA kinase [Hydromonas duriensis]